MDILREVVLPKLDAVKKSGTGFMARCPVPDHPDRKASLSVSPGTTHPVVLHCQSGCTPEAVCAAIGLDWADLCKPRDDRKRDDTWTPAGPAVAVYDYRDEEGNLLYQVCRTAKKDFRQRRPDPTAKSGYAWNLDGVRKVLYRLPKVIAAVARGELVWIVEGEKDVHTLEAQGMAATCNSGGGGPGKWLPEYSQYFRDAVVMIVADNDKTGQAHARAIRDSLTGIAADITLAEALTGKDVTDHVTAGHGLEDLVTTWRTDPPAKPELAQDIWEFLATDDPPHNWIVPGLLERGDRLILTGFEGQGKSMLIRQLAICIAAGINPFWHDKRFPPQKVLLIDCENSEAQSRRKLRPIAEISKHFKGAQKIPHGGLRLIHRPEGMDLTTESDAAWLIERVTAHQPDVLFIGPFYRLHQGNMNDEVFARRTVAILDRARAITNCALITEAHAGHGEAGKSRSVRPTGSSLLLRWPEFGYGLAPNAMSVPDDLGRSREMDFVSWRGPRDDRDWPTHIRYGREGEMPWQPYKPEPLPDPKKGK